MKVLAQNSEIVLKTHILTSISSELEEQEDRGRHFPLDTALEIGKSRKLSLGVVSFDALCSAPPNGESLIAKVLLENNSLPSASGLDQSLPDTWILSLEGRVARTG